MNTIHDYILNAIKMNGYDTDAIELYIFYNNDLDNYSAIVKNNKTNETHDFQFSKDVFEDIYNDDNLDEVVSLITATCKLPLKSEQEDYELANDEDYEDVISKLSNYFSSKGYDISNASIKVVADNKGTIYIFDDGMGVYQVLPGDKNEPIEKRVDKLVNDEFSEKEVNDFLESFDNLNKVVQEGITNVCNVAPIHHNAVPENLSSKVTNYPSLLIALDSEKDAIVTYENLINIEKSFAVKNKEIIDLLEKILADEKEHIALLSALQAKNNADDVAEDSIEDFDSFISDAKDSIDED